MKLAAHLPRFVMLLAAGFAAVGFAGSAWPPATVGSRSHGVCCGFCYGDGANCVLNSVLPWFSPIARALLRVCFWPAWDWVLWCSGRSWGANCPGGMAYGFCRYGGCGWWHAGGGLPGAAPAERGRYAGAGERGRGDDLTPSDSSRSGFRCRHPERCSVLGTREMLRTRAFWTLFCWISLVSSGVWRLSQRGSCGSRCDGNARGVGGDGGHGAMGAPRASTAWAVSWQAACGIASARAVPWPRCPLPSLSLWFCAPPPRSSVRFRWL